MFPEQGKNLNFKEYMKNMMEDCEIKLPNQHVQTRKLVNKFQN